MCLGGIYEKPREDQLRAAYQKQTKYTQRTINKYLVTWQRDNTYYGKIKLAPFPEGEKKPIKIKVNIKVDNYVLQTNIFTTL